MSAVTPPSRRRSTTVPDHTQPTKPFPSSPSSLPSSRDEIYIRSSTSQPCGPHSLHSRTQHPQPPLALSPRSPLRLLSPHELDDGQSCLKPTRGEHQSPPESRTAACSHHTPQIRRTSPPSKREGRAKVALTISLPVLFCLEPAPRLHLIPSFHLLRRRWLYIRTLPDETYDYDGATGVLIRAVPVS